MAAAGGLLLACAFPKPNVAGLGWVAPAIILLAGLGAKPGTALRTGYVAGLAFFLSSLYWLLLIPVPLAPMVGWLAVGFYLAIYPATWVWVAWRIFPGSFEGVEPGRAGLLTGFTGTTWGQRLRWCLLAAAAWVTWEMIQARVFGGFPWNLLSASQYRLLPLIQVSAVAGAYALSFVMVWFSLSLLCAFARLLKEPAKRGWMGEMIAPGLVVAMLMGWGVKRARELEPESGRALRVALVQPAIPQEVVWDQSREKKAERFASLMRLSEEALTNKPALLVWPEAALPDLLRYSTNEYSGRIILDAVTDLARRHGVWMVIGADDAEIKPGTREEVLFYNSSFLISPRGELMANYRKRRLVMFGEYVPLSRWLPFLKTFAQVHGEFTPGEMGGTFDLGELDAQTSILICFEDAFPHLTREDVNEATDFLLNLTNNGWFGESAAQWQHAANAVFRAVENGVPLVRCANNGLTCWVDRRGGMHEVYFSGTKDVYKAGYKIADVPLPGTGGWSATPFRRSGEWFGWGCVVVTGIAVAGSFVGRRKKVE